MNFKKALQAISTVAKKIEFSAVGGNSIFLANSCFSLVVGLEPDDEDDFINALIEINKADLIYWSVMALAETKDVETWSKLVLEIKKRCPVTFDLMKYCDEDRPHLAWFLEPWFGGSNEATTLPMNEKIFKTILEVVNNNTSFWSEASSLDAIGEALIAALGLSASINGGVLRDKFFDLILNQDTNVYENAIIEVLRFPPKDENLGSVDFLTELARSMLRVRPIHQHFKNKNNYDNFFVDVLNCGDVFQKEAWYKIVKNLSPKNNETDQFFKSIDALIEIYKKNGEGPLFLWHERIKLVESLQLNQELPRSSRVAVL